MSTTSPTGRLVVAVDGSPAADRALRWAAREAERQHRPLHVLHAAVAASSYAGAGVFSALSEDDVERLLEASRQLLADAVDVARSTAPTTTVRSELAEDAPAPAVLEASTHAHLVVLGARGLGSVRSLLLGSVSTQVAMHARCPVIVVKDVDDPDRPRDGVVVGVDGSAHDQGALGFAFEQAASRGTSLEVVNAWSSDLVPFTGVFVEALQPQYQVGPEHQLLLSEALAGWREKYPDVEVRTTVAHGDAATVLLERGDGAELLVVSARGRGGFAGLLLGSVSHSVLQRAGAPVAVVR